MSVEATYVFYFHFSLQLRYQPALIGFEKRDIFSAFFYFYRLSVISISQKFKSQVLVVNRCIYVCRFALCVRFEIVQTVIVRFLQNTWIETESFLLMSSYLYFSPNFFYHTQGQFCLALKCLVLRRQDGGIDFRTNTSARVCVCQKRILKISIFLLKTYATRNKTAVINICHEFR